MVVSPVHPVWPKPSCKAQWKEEEDKAHIYKGTRTHAGTRTQVSYAQSTTQVKQIIRRGLNDKGGGKITHTKQQQHCEKGNMAGLLFQKKKCFKVGFERVQNGFLSERKGKAISCRRAENGKGTRTYNGTSHRRNREAETVSEAERRVREDVLSCRQSRRKGGAVCVYTYSREWLSCTEFLVELEASGEIETEEWMPDSTRPVGKHH